MQQQPHPPVLNNISRPNTQTSQPLIYPAASSRINSQATLPFHSLHTALAIMAAEANARAASSNISSAASQMPLGYPHPVSGALAPRAQIQQRHSYPPSSIDIRHPPGPSPHPVQMGGAVPSTPGPRTLGPSAPRPSAPAGTNMPSYQPPNPPTPTQSVSSSVRPDPSRTPSAPISAPPPEIASLL